MKEFQPPAGHNPADGDSTSDFTGDPLERLVEAFVEQSVPTGPDAATRRQMLAAMQAADRGDMIRLHEPVQQDEQPRETRVPRARHWLAIAGRQVVGIAAAIAVVVAAALYTMSRHNDQPTPQPAGGGQLMAEAPAIDAAGADPLKDMPRELVGAIDLYLRTHGGRAPDTQAVKEIFDAYLRNNPRLADSPSLRFAQARLSYALEQPEFIGLGVGILGTIPWTTYARF